MTARLLHPRGLSLIIVPGTDATLSAHAYTMGDMFHGLGYPNLASSGPFRGR
jgi:hypothetical protein